MASGTRSTVDFLSQQLLERWVPKWYEAFVDPETGGFYERLGKSFKPVNVGYRRLVTQCRQLALYSDASRRQKNFKPDLHRHFEHLVLAYLVPETGGWRFSTDDTGKGLDNRYDLYGHAFVIFALSHYYRASGAELARRLAHDTRAFIERSFRQPGLPGYAEGLGEDLKPYPALRRQNPHMHLLEACLFAAETWDDPAWMLLATDIIGLFKDYFYDREKNWLCEFFRDDLSPHPDEGTLVEPGHYCEWVWLLKKHARLSGDANRHAKDCAALLRWANKYGWDTQHGGIYDVLHPDGTVVRDTKRLWPFAEALKANALMLDADFDRDELKARMADMVRVFREGYMEERGFWTETLNRDLGPATDYMPGTTPYHVYFGITETRDTLAGRGASKSWAAGPVAAAYRARRTLSGWVKAVRLFFKR
jgi:mannose-6-phosphate isomerase